MVLYLFRLGTPQDESQTAQKPEPISGASGGQKEKTESCGPTTEIGPIRGIGTGSFSLTGHENMETRPAKPNRNAGAAGVEQGLIG